MRASFDDLKTFEQKGSGGYLKSMRENLVNIAFFLEPEVDKLMQDWIRKEAEKYSLEHSSNDQFYQDLLQKEKIKFDILYQSWKESVVRFHLLKQENAIEVFIDLMESVKFVNPSSRVYLLSNLNNVQSQVFEQRLALFNQLDNQQAAYLNKEFVNAIDDRLK